MSRTVWNESVAVARPDPKSTANDLPLLACRHFFVYVFVYVHANVFARVYMYLHTDMCVRVSAERNRTFIKRSYVTAT